MQICDGIRVNWQIEFEFVVEWVFFFFITLEFKREIKRKEILFTQFMKEKDVTSARLRNNQKRNKPSVMVNEKLRERKNA